MPSAAGCAPKHVQTEKEGVRLVCRTNVDIPSPRMERKPAMPADADIQVAEVK
jgi:hypothetical protein